MIVLNPSYEILTPISLDGLEELRHIESIGRVCYKSEDKMQLDGNRTKEFISRLIKRGHESVLEHSTLSIKFIVDRGITHELVRHRLASFSQESTRYCNYRNEKFGSECSFIGIENSISLDTHMKKLDSITINRIVGEWYQAMSDAERHYNNMIELGASPQIARGVLPNSLKSELIITANYRQWRNILKLRVDKGAHPQMREITISLLKELQSKIPIIFDDITEGACLGV